MRSLALIVLLVGCSLAQGNPTSAQQPSPAVQTSPTLAQQQATAIQTSPQVTRILTKTRSLVKGRSFFRTMGEEIMNYLGFGTARSDDYDDYDESEYYYPQQLEGILGGGNNPGSSYSFYNPYGNNNPSRDDNFEEEDDSYSWGSFMIDAAVVAVPMAMVLAAMPTGLFTIPVIGRSLDNDVEDTLKPYELPILKAVEKADFLSYTTRGCQERVFCELAQIGRHRDSSVLQKMAYFMASLTPDHYADSYGLNKLFKSSREGHCEEYKCVPLMAPTKFLGKH